MTTTTASCLQEAMANVLRHWPVIPLHGVDTAGECTCGNSVCPSPGKHPRTDHGLKDASTDPAMIVDWWQRWPDANLGIITGQQAGLVVLDIDPDDGGSDSLAALEQRHSPLPSTVEAITGGGGRHLYFRSPAMPIRNSAGKLGSGVDVRAEGGYVVAPTSQHSSGQRYEWDGSYHPDDTDLSDMPAWLVGLLAIASSSGGKGTRGKGNAPNTIPSGERNDTLTSIAGAMRRHGADEAAILAALRQVNADQCVPPLDDPELVRIAGSIGNYQPLYPVIGQVPGAVPTHRPAICTNQKDLPKIRLDSWGAVRISNDIDPLLFRFGNSLVRLELDSSSVPLLQEVTPDRLRYTLGNAAVWYGINSKGIRFSDLPPLHVVHDLLADPTPPLPPLTRIVEAPVFGPSGVLQTSPGYHSDSRTYYKPMIGFSIPAVSDSPTAAEVERARALILDELLVDFPFVSEAERANAVGLFLLPFVRDLIDDPTPAHLIEAPTPGSGKGLLADVLLRPAIGRHIGIMTAANDDDEWRKRITAQLREARAAILIDNVTRPLDSGVLAAALTASTWEDRLLGSSETLRAPVRCVWVVTANNPTMSTEIARRCVRIRLDPHVDRPWQRSTAQFHHHPLEAWVDAHRGDFVWAAATFVRYWISAGKPDGTITLGSYEQWSRIVGGILATAGINGFISNLSDFYEVSDLEGQVWRQFVEAWWDKHSSAPVTAGELFAIAVTIDGMPVGRGSSERAQRTAFGMALGRQRDRVIGRWHIADAGKMHGGKVWKLEPVVKVTGGTLGEPCEPREPLQPSYIQNSKNSKSTLSPQGSPGYQRFPYSDLGSPHTPLISPDDPPDGGIRGSLVGEEGNAVEEPFDPAAMQMPLRGQVAVDRAAYEAALAAGLSPDEAMAQAQIGGMKVTAWSEQGEGEGA